MVVMAIMIMMMVMISIFNHLTTASCVQFLIMCCIVLGNSGTKKIIQLVKKSHAFDGNRRFTRHWVLTYDEWSSNSQNFQLEIQKLNTQIILRNLRDFL